MARGKNNPIETPPEDLVSKQQVGGYQVNNLLSSNLFMTRNKNIILSFEINDIVSVDGEEIMKLAFPRLPGIVVRVMKYMNEELQPVAIFDVVNLQTKEVLLTHDKEFIGGAGIEHLFYQSEMITQWEIPILLKLCRAFVLGDVETIEHLIKDYYLKFSDESAVRLTNKLGIKR